MTSGTEAIGHLPKPGERLGKYRVVGERGRGGMAVVLEVEHPGCGRLKLAGFPFKFSRTPCAVRRAPPMLGEHSEELLGEVLNLSDDEIEELVSAGVVGR